MAPRRRRRLTEGQTLTAVRAALGPVLDHLGHLGVGDELARRALVPRLATRLAARRRALTPWPRPWRIGRWRARGVPGAFPQPLLEPLDPRLKSRDLALLASRQLDEELSARLTASVIDHLGLGTLHTGKVRCKPTSSSLCEPRGESDIATTPARAGWGG